MINKIEIKVLKNKRVNIQSIVKIHQESLKNNVLTNFGKNFLIRMYTNLIANKENVIIIAKLENRVIGYIVINFYRENFFKYLRLFDLIIFFKNLISKSHLIFSVYYQLLHKKNYPDNNSCEISHFAVMKKYRSIGIGNKLISEFIIYAKNKKKNF